MENIISYLELNAIEICILSDMKMVVNNFYNSLELGNDIDPNSILSLFKGCNIINDFFLV
uniref:hypothetical protein n=1 Tax=Borreliella californiensis TaxID=373543 RepID=UPI003B21AFF5